MRRPPSSERWATGVILAAVILLGSFFVGGAALIWQASDLLALPTLPVLHVAVAMADLGWRFWGH